MVERANKRQTRVRSIDVPKSKRLDDLEAVELREGIFATFCRDLETPAEIGRDSFEIGHPSYPPSPPSFLALGLLLGYYVGLDGDTRVVAVRPVEIQIITVSRFRTFFKFPAEKLSKEVSCRWLDLRLPRIVHQSNPPRTFSYNNNK